MKFKYEYKYNCIDKLLEIVLSYLQELIHPRTRIQTSLHEQYNL